MQRGQGECAQWGRTERWLRGLWEGKEPVIHVTGAVRQGIDEHARERAIHKVIVPGAWGRADLSLCADRILITTF